MIRQIVEIGDPILRRQATPVPRGRIAEPAIRYLIVDLLDTLHDFQLRTGYGRGIAAPQIGAAERVVVIDPARGRSLGEPVFLPVPRAAALRLPFARTTGAPLSSAPQDRPPGPVFPLVLINPTIVARSDKTALVWDACFSCWGLFFQVERARTVTVDYLDPDGVARRIDAQGDLAELLQHEIDHLDGVLAIDLIADPWTISSLREYRRRVEGSETDSPEGEPGEAGGREARLSHPPATSLEQKMSLVRTITDRLRAAFANQVVAVGLYGSLGRGEAGPYSDLELYLVLDSRPPTAPERYEFVYQGFKVEVDLETRAGLLEEAAAVDDDWPIRAGAFVDVLPVYDPTGFFAELRRAALAVTPEATRAAIAQYVVDEVYETMGKLRNAWLGGAPARHPSYVPLAAHDLAWQTAKLLGLAHRHYFYSRSTTLTDSLALKPLPDGYSALVALVTDGDLQDKARLYAACERLWCGLEAWLGSLGVVYLCSELPF